MKYNPVISDPIERNSEYPPSMQTFVFESHGEKLVGTAFLAQGKEPHPILLLLHGFPGNEVNFDLAHAARRAGWTVVVFHYRGGWGSSGSYSFSNCIEDTEEAIKFICTESFALKTRSDSSKLVIAGHSLGGFIALKKVLESKTLHHAGFMAGFNFGYFANVLQSVPWAKNIALERLNDGIELLNNVSAQDLLDEMTNNRDHWDLIKLIPNETKKNVLIVDAKFDSTAPIDIHHKPLVAALKNKMNVSVNASILEAGHSFSNSRIQLTQKLIDWLQKIRF